MHPPLDARLADIANRQHGLVTAAQLRFIHIDANAVRRRVRSGLLHRVHSRVYAVGHANMPDDRRWMAAVLSAGERAGLSHASAARLWGIWRGAEFGTHVVTPHQLGRRRHRSVQVHFSRKLDRSDITTRRGIALTSVSRTIVDLAEMLTPHQLANVMHEAEYRHLFNLADVVAVADRLRGRRFISIVPRAIEANHGGSVGTRSMLEDRFLKRTLETVRDTPTVNAHVQAGERTIEVDFLWSRQRVVVEIDGPGHGRARTRAEDVRRDRLLQANGYKVLRITADEMRSGAELKLAQLQKLLNGHDSGQG